MDISVVPESYLAFVSGACALAGVEPEIKTYPATRKMALTVSVSVSMTPETHAKAKMVQSVVQTIFNRTQKYGPFAGSCAASHEDSYADYGDDVAGTSCYEVDRLVFTDADNNKELILQFCLYGIDGL